MYMNRVPELTDKSLQMLRSVQGSPISRLYTLNSVMQNLDPLWVIRFVCITQYIQTTITESEKKINMDIILV